MTARRLPSADPDPAPAASRRVSPRLAAVATAFALAGIVLFTPWLYARWYAERVYPGVQAAGVDLGGLTAAEAVERLRDAIPVLAGTVTLSDPGGERTWDVAAADLGLDIRPEAWAERAIEVGRDDDDALVRLLAPLRLRWSGHDVAPAGIPVDPDVARRTLEELRDTINVAPQAGTIAAGDGRVEAVPPALGRALDIDATLAALDVLAGRPVTRTLELAMGGTSARVGDVANVAEAYNLIVSSPIAMTWEEGQSYTIGVDRLTAWFRIEDVVNPEGDSVPSIIVDRAAIRQFIAPLAPEIDHPAADAKYVIDPATGRFVRRDAGRPAVALDVDGSVEAVIRAAYSDQRVGTLAVREAGSDVSPEIVAELNRTVEEISRVTTTFAGAPPGWVAALLVAADRLNGATLAPGQTFSFNRALGPVSAATGYDVAFTVDPLVAEGAPGSGGGITQVATTAFRAAVWAGLPIVERHAPTARIGWLEPPIGLDAAVSPPAQDLQFINDSDGYVVFTTTLDVEQGWLTWIVYGKPRAREVTLTGPTVRSITAAADDLRRNDARVPAGQSDQVAWAREGAETTVVRRVDENGRTVLEDELQSAYRPIGNIVLVGTGAAPD